jgi:N utilization substance protein A
MRGSRVQSVVQELKGEKIDIVPFSEDSVKYICSALSPAKVSKVFMYEDERSMEVIVPDDQLSLAIGKSGQNVRLAVRLTGWKIDVKNESMLQKQSEEGPKALMKIPDLDEASAELLFKEGFKSVSALSTADPEALKAIEGLDAEKVQGIIERAAQVMEKEAGGTAPEPQG